MFWDRNMVLERYKLANVLNGIRLFANVYARFSHFIICRVCHFTIMMYYSYIYRNYSLKGGNSNVK